MRASNTLWTSLRVLICIFAIGWTLYAYIDKQNELVELRLALPSLQKEVKGIQEENARLQFQIDRFENPIHLMELSRRPEFTHLKYPYTSSVITLPEPPPLTLEESPQ